MSKSISIIIPTMDGREYSLRNCVEMYLTWTNPDVDLEFTILRNRDASGIAWEEGIRRSTGDYIHLTADDIYPFPGWHKDALTICDEGSLPAPTLYGPDGDEEKIGSETISATRVPIMSYDQAKSIGPLIPVHYYIENWISDRGRDAGYETVEVPSYRFVHNHTTERVNYSQRMMEHQQLYHQYSRDGSPYSRVLR